MIFHDVDGIRSKKVGDARIGLVVGQNLKQGEW